MIKPIAKINSNTMPIHIDGYTICTNDNVQAMKARIARLKRELKANQ